MPGTSFHMKVRVYPCESRSFCIIGTSCPPSQQWLQVVAGTPEFRGGFEAEELAGMMAGMRQDESGARRAALLHRFLCLLTVSHSPKYQHSNSRVRSVFFALQVGANLFVPPLPGGGGGMLPVSG